MVDPLSRALMRRLARQRWQTSLAIVGIALGVAVVTAVDLANQSVRRAFDLSLAQITGHATHRIIGGARPHGVDERFYAALRREHGVSQAAPVVEGVLRLHGGAYRLLGIDPLAEAPFRPWTPLLGTPMAGELLTRPNSVLMAAADARRMGLSVGDSVVARAAGVENTIHLVGLLDSGNGNNAQALNGLLLADIASAQELLGRIGHLDRIDLILDERTHQQVAALLPANLRLVVPQTRNRAVAELSSSFHANVSAMSLLALLVGGFLIANAIGFSVLQRRRLLGLLRMIGATRLQLFARIISEALALGACGTALGLLAGMWLGQGLIKLVARTVNDLYFATQVSTLLIQPHLLLKGLALGLLVTLIAALVPAIEAARASPQAAVRRSARERRTHAMLPRLALAGGAAMLLAAAFVQLAQLPQLLQLPQLPGNALWLAFAGLFCLIIGYCLVVPLPVLGLSRLCTPPLARAFAIGPTGALAARGIAAGLSRTGLAISALAVAVAATIGMGVMVDGFRGTVAGWLARSLPGDLYISIPAGTSRRAATPLPAALLEELRGMDGIAALSTGRRVEVESAAGPVDLLALDMAPASYRSFRFQGESAAAAAADRWREFHRGEAVLISEPLGFRRKLSVGDSLELWSADGARSFTVGGVFRDYGSQRGLVVMDRQVYARLWRDADISTIGVYFRESARPQQLTRRIESLAAQQDARIRVRANREIQRYSLAVFDRTFTITQVLRLLVVLVAFVGILSALLALQLERARENAVLRATGLTRLGLFAMTTLQTGLMGLFAGLLALPLGYLIGQILLHLVNPRSFGWTLDAQPALQVYFEALGLAVGAALLAGIYPGWRMARANPAAALREE